MDRKPAVDFKRKKPGGERQGRWGWGTPLNNAIQTEQRRINDWLLEKNGGWTWRMQPDKVE